MIERVVMTFEFPMKVFLTEVKIGEKIFAGKNVIANSWEEAEYKAYPAIVVGELVCEIEVNMN